MLLYLFNYGPYFYLFMPTFGSQCKSSTSKVTYAKETQAIRDILPGRFEIALKILLQLEL